MEEPSSRPELKVRYYPRRVRPGAGSGDLTPSQAVRLVEQAGQAGAADEPRAYTDPKPAAPAPQATQPAPQTTQPAPQTTQPAPQPAADTPRRARHASTRRSWWARLRSRLRG